VSQTVTAIVRVKEPSRVPSSTTAAGRFVSGGENYMGIFSEFFPDWAEVPHKNNAGRVYQAEDIIIATDFEGGNGKDIERTAPNTYRVLLEPEEGDHSYEGVGYFYNVGILNKQNVSRQIIVELRAECKGKADFSSQEYAVTRYKGQWKNLGRDNVYPGGDANRLLVRLALLPSSEMEGPVLLSNFHVWPYSEIVSWIHKTRRASIIQIGKSFQGRPIFSLELGNPRGTVIVNTATSQPSEMGPLLCRGIVEHLLTSGDDELLDRFHFCFLPVTNPDGTVLGNGLVDSQGRFEYFEGYLAAEGSNQAVPETICLWNYLARKQPYLFWEWHSNNWKRRPGQMLLRYRHELNHDPEKRRVWDNIEEDLLKLPNVFHEDWTSRTEGPYQGSMGFQAAERLQSIALMLKVHEKYSVEKNKDFAVTALRTALDHITGRNP
jgi:hypothetical protein